MAKFDIALVAVHLPGKTSEAADALSRNDLPRFFAQVPNAAKRTISDTTGVTRHVSKPSARLDFQGLEESVHFHFSKGLASSTQRTYKAGKTRYVTFCTKASISPLPVCERHLCSFVAYFAKEGLKFCTIKVYLSAVRHGQIEAAMPDPFKGAPMARL